MQVQEILRQYQTLQQIMPEAKLPELKTSIYHLDVDPKIYSTVGAVYDVLDRFNPISGWLDYQSGKQYFINKPLVPSPDYDMLLNAELVNDNNTSLHVRYNGNSGWIVTQYHYGKGDDYIVDEVKHLASFDKSGNTTLQYLRFWKIQDGILGMNPVFACFVGFEEKK